MHTEGKHELAWHGTVSYGIAWHGKAWDVMVWWLTCVGLLQ